MSRYIRYIQGVTRSFDILYAMFTYGNMSEHSELRETPCI